MTPLGKYPTHIEYVPIKKSLSMRNLLNRKVSSNPDSSNNIQALQMALHDFEGAETKHASTNRLKLGIRIPITEVKLTE